MSKHTPTDFSGLTPDVVLQWVEDALAARATNLCRPLTSYINRVYEVKLEDDSWVVAKFYRPGRWSRTALEDEQEFVTELAAAEVPVIPPLRCHNGQTLQEKDGLNFALFPKRGGRPLEEPTGAQWRELGRLLARVHLVGAEHQPRDRIHIHPRHSSESHLRDILSHDFPSPSLKREYERAAREILDSIAPQFDGLENIRLHGDCHALNIIVRPGEPFHLIDFDDLAVGPPIQDLWMLLPGQLRHAQDEMGLLLDGYETLREFEHATLRLIEPLRFMRFIHYTAWCARQARDGGFARLAPDWGTASYWKQQIADLTPSGYSVDR